ncbi:MAG: choice-of-anchor J domain-containing protein, partial [Desulfobulbaceae bacterium]|nr:choice-of-anchor J domain-containing protein [Desulfobulbaceae bacterium]
MCLRSQQEEWGGGLFYVATVCDGNYPTITDSRLISPEIDLRGVEIAGNEELSLRFRHWFSYYSSDYGTVQISEYNEGTGSWSTFTNISGAIVYSSAVWSPMSIDISAYAGKKVRIAFYHYTHDDSGVGAGWYVDHVEIIKKEPEWTGDFEEGWGDWHTDNGVWEVGTPTYGPSFCYSGEQCAGTVLGGSYPTTTDSQLISPTLDLTGIEIVGDEELHLRFWHWFSYYSSDYGIVQISEYDESLGSWSAFTNISGAIVYSSAVWSPKSIDISAYAGKKVRIAFYHYTHDDSGVGAGWYVDDVEIIKKVPEPTWDFECGWDDWYTDNGVWEVGVPTYGPSVCYSGEQCAGTILSGKYPTTTDSRLISPSFYLPADGALSFSFWHWFSYYSSDYGIVQISEYDESLGSWSAFTNISGAIVYSS